MPEQIWKSYIDFEVELRDLTRARQLYERLLGKTKHVKVWVAAARFEATQAKDISKARAFFCRALDHFKEKEPDLKEERLMVLENWLSIEESHNKLSEEVSKVKARFPKRVKKRRRTKVVDT